MVFDIVLRESTSSNQKLRLLSQGGGLLLDGSIHHWLRETRLVSFVVAVATVADNVDDNVFLVLGAVQRLVGRRS